MKRRILAAIAAAGLLLGTVVLAGATPSGAAAGERASGRGLDNSGNAFSVRARGLGTGTAATGAFKVTHPSGHTVEGDVTCLSVNSFSGGIVGATIGGTVTKSSDSNVPVGIETVFELRDLDGFDGALQLEYFESSDPCSVGYINPDTIQKGRVALVDDGA